MLRYDMIFTNFSLQESVLDRVKSLVVGFESTALFAARPTADSYKIQT